MLSARESLSGIAIPRTKFYSSFVFLHEKIPGAGYGIGDFFMKREFSAASAPGEAVSDNRQEEFEYQPQGKTSQQSGNDLLASTDILDAENVGRCHDNKTAESKENQAGHGCDKWNSQNPEYMEADPIYGVQDNQGGDDP